MAALWFNEQEPRHKNHELEFTASLGYNRIMQYLVSIQNLQLLGVRAISYTYNVIQYENVRPTIVEISTTARMYFQTWFKMSL